MVNIFPNFMKTINLAIQEFDELQAEETLTAAKHVLFEILETCDE